MLGSYLFIFGRKGSGVQFLRPGCPVACDTRSIERNVGGTPARNGSFSRYKYMI